VVVGFGGVHHARPLSDEPKKSEYTFAPRTRFKMTRTDQVAVSENPMVVIALQPEPGIHWTKEGDVGFAPGL